MVQQVLIVLLFLGAVAYLGRILYRSFSAKAGCEGECKCQPASEAGTPAKSASKV